LQGKKKEAICNIISVLTERLDGMCKMENTLLWYSVCN